MLTPFTEQPESQIVAIGENVEFRCRHETADYIGWKVNGSPILSDLNSRNISIANFSVPGGPSRSILILGAATPTYNGSVVTCMAVFTNNCPSQNSLFAPLLIQGKVCQR